MTMDTYLQTIDMLNAVSSLVLGKRKKKLKSNLDTLLYWKVLQIFCQGLLEGIDKEFMELWQAGTFLIVLKREENDTYSQIVPSPWTSLAKSRNTRHNYVCEVT